MNIRNFSIYVNNLSFEITEDELRNEFAVFGEVASEYGGNGQQRRYAFVEMASRSEGEAAIANLEGKKIRNTIINVIKALPLSRKNESGSLNIRSSSRFNRKERR